MNNFAIDFSQFFFINNYYPSSHTLDTTIFISLLLSISFSLKTRGNDKFGKSMKHGGARGAIFQFASRKKETSTKVSCVGKSFPVECTLPRKAAKREVYSAKLSRGPPRVHAEYANNIIFLTFLSLNPPPPPGKHR